MRASLLFALALVAVQTLAQDAPPDLRAAIEAHLRENSRSAIELISLGQPVPAASCRLFDRGKGIWVAPYDSGIAVHIRYRTRDRFGAAVIHSKVAFVDTSGKVQSTVETGAVRSSDPNLFK